MENYSKNSEVRYLLETDVEYSEELHKRHNDFSFLPLRIKIGKTCVQFVCKKECDLQFSTLKRALDHKLVLQKVYILIKFNQKSRLKKYFGLT